MALDRRLRGKVAKTLIDSLIDSRYYGEVTFKLEGGTLVYCRLIQSHTDFEGLGINLGVIVPPDPTNLKKVEASASS